MRLGSKPSFVVLPPGRRGQSKSNTNPDRPPIEAGAVELSPVVSPVAAHRVWKRFTALNSGGAPGNIHGRGKHSESVVKNPSLSTILTVSWAPAALNLRLTESHLTSQFVLRLVTTLTSISASHCLFKLCMARPRV